MASAVNPSTPTGITIGSAFGSLGEWLRRMTVRVISSPQAHGSGVVWRQGGLIVTNAHVAGSEAHEIEFDDGRRAQAWLRLQQAAGCLATITVAGRSSRSWDGVGALTTGILHRACGKGPWVVADIRLAPGNSGGPLADAHGNVVGINSMIVDGFGWAVSSDAVDAFLTKARLAEAV